MVCSALQAMATKYKKQALSAVLAEQHDERGEGRRYLTITHQPDYPDLPAGNILDAAA